MNSDYLEFLYKLGLFNIKLGLSTISNMLKRLGSPHHHPQIVHIAGTNGKGSTLVTLERLLLESGFSTGSTISPHLQSFNERFRINGKTIDDKSLDHAFESVCSACDIDLNLTKQESKDGTLKPTFFEFAIAIAFFLFKKHEVDYVLLETGLGGRLDATNVIEKPIACVLTRIALDHQEFLGNDLESITKEKLGIIKQDVPVFVSKQYSTVEKQIIDHCEGNGNVVYKYPTNFSYQFQELEQVLYRIEAVDRKQSKEFVNERIVLENQSLLGDHQKENTSTALATYFGIVPKSRSLSTKGVIKALQRVQWQGRLEYLDKEKKILLDGAHNQSSMETLFGYLEKNHRHHRILFAISWKQDKRLSDAIFIDGLSSVTFLPVKMSSEAAVKIETLTLYLKLKNVSTLPPVSVPELIDQIRSNLLPNHDLLVVAGSLYLVGEFLSVWYQS